MKKLAIVITIAIILITLSSLFLVRKEAQMELTSPAFKDGESIPSKYTCDADNINPPLAISGVPEGTNSLVLIMDDPDAPSKVWVHWVLFNISPSTTEIPENSLPSGSLQGINDFGKTNYGGPCPPSGTHRYKFKLYALDMSLNLKEGDSKEGIENAMQGHVLEQTELTGLYSRG